MANAEKEPSFDHRGLYESSSDTKSSNGKRYVAGLALAMTGGTVLMGLGTAFGETARANADNVIVYGGRGTFPDENTSQTYKQFLIDTGQVSTVADNIIAVNYPAQIAPLDQITQRQSTDIGVANGQVALDTQTDPNQRTRVYGYSQGTASAIELTNKNPGRIAHLTIDKGPYGPGGLANNPQALDPGLQSLGESIGLVMREELPTNIPVTVRSSRADVWSGGGNLEVNDVLANVGPTLFGNSHRMVNPAEPHATEQYGNVTVEWYDNDAAPAPAAALAPAPAPVEALPPAPEVAKSSTPSFFGEQPCYAPDGSQYYTPGDAPC